MRWALTLILIFVTSSTWADTFRDFSKVDQIGRGGGVVCAKSVLEGVKCWCDDSNCEIAMSMVPSDLGPVDELAVGSVHVCARKGDDIHCWGPSNNYGMLTPPKLTNVFGLSLGGEGHSYREDGACASTAEGVKCWGYTLGAVPDDLGQVVGLTKGRFDTCAIQYPAGNLKCWWGDEPGSYQKIPIALNHPAQVAIGDDFKCVNDRDGVKCWGDNSFGQTQVPKNLKNITQIAANGQSACAIADKRVVCWGLYPDVPKDIVNPKQVLVSSGGYTKCALTESSIKCWVQDQEWELK